MSARLMLVRHGEIEANARRVWHGSTDSPLTERGELQARLTAACLEHTARDATTLYTSPLIRAHRTAEAIGAALGLEPKLEDDLCEYSIGELEGVSYEALFKEHRFFERIREDPDFAPPGGESPKRVTERVTDALRRIAAHHRGERVIVVGHGAALALALGDLLSDLGRWQRYQKSNCSLSELEIEPSPRLLSFDVTDHLP